MQVNLTGHHVEITSALKDHLNNKLTRIERHFDSVTSIKCILTVEKLRHKAEAKINVTGGTKYADTVQEDMYAAIDGLIDKLDRQVIKYKEKKSNYRSNNNVPKVAEAE